MFIFPLDTTSVTSGSAGYSYCSEIQLFQKYHDMRDLTLKVDIGGGSVSGLLSIVPAISALSGGTFANFVTASGTSKLLSSGTSTGGTGDNGSYAIPLTIVNDSGVTKFLTGVPFIKFGFACNNNDVSVAASLIVG